MNSNVVQLVIPKRKSVGFQMPSKDGVRSNVAAYVDTLELLEPARYKATFQQVFGIADLNADWSKLDFSKVELFLRTWYQDTSLQLIAVLAYKPQGGNEVFEGSELFVGVHDLQGDTLTWGLFFRQ